MNLPVSDAKPCECSERFKTLVDSRYIEGLKIRNYRCENCGQFWASRYVLSFILKDLDPNPK